METYARSRVKTVTPSRSPGQARSPAESASQSPIEERLIHRIFAREMFQNWCVWEESNPVSTITQYLFLLIKLENQESPCTSMKGIAMPSAIALTKIPSRGTKS